MVAAPLVGQRLPSIDPDGEPSDAVARTLSVLLHLALAALLWPTTPGGGGGASGAAGGLGDAGGMAIPVAMVSLDALQEATGTRPVEPSETDAPVPLSEPSQPAPAEPDTVVPLSTPLVVPAEPAIEPVLPAPLAFAPPRPAERPRETPARPAWPEPARQPAPPLAPAPALDPVDSLPGATAGAADAGPAGQTDSGGAAGGAAGDAALGRGEGPVVGPSGIGPQDYAALVRAWLERHKRYPAAARQRSVEGVVTLRFTIAADGTVVSQQVSRGSGSHLLDTAARDLLQRASPLPPVPADFGVERLTLTVPIAFSLR